MKEYKEQLEFSRWIGDVAIDDAVSLETIFSRLTVDLKRIFKAQRIGIFSVSGNQWMPLEFGVMSRSSKSKPVLRQNLELPREVRQGTVIIREDSKDHTATLFIPVLILEDFLVLVVVQGKMIGHKVKHLSDDIVPFAQDVCNRISMLIHYKEEKRTEQIKDGVLKAFFDHQLNTELTPELAQSEYWNDIANSIASFLPNWGPFKIDPLPLVQILTYHEGDRYMTLRSTKGNHNSIPLKVEETICGLLIEENKDVLLINPASQYTQRYKAYLFGAATPKSELVVAVRYNKEIVALLNLEHPGEKVFSEYHISSLRKIADILAPLIKTLLLREDAQRSKEVSLIYVMTDLLKRMVSMYRHKINQLFPKSLLTIEELEELTPDNQRIRENLANLRTFIKEFKLRTTTFLQDLPDYVNYGPIDICQEIREAINEFDPEALRRKEKVSIDFYPLSDNPRVYASPLVREHIYNLLNNSLDAVQDAIARKSIRNGEIAVNMRKKKVEDAYAIETSPCRIYVQIDDNGGGVAPEHYSHIEKFGYTTKRERGGSGLGLSAAKEYVRFVDGDLKTENDYGKGFSVSFYLQEYDPSFHKELSFGQKEKG